MKTLTEVLYSEIPMFKLLCSRLVRVRGDIVIVGWTTLGVSRLWRIFLGEEWIMNLLL